MDSDMTASLERVGAIEKREGGLWGITKAGREMSVLLAGLARDPKDDGINFNYGEWQEADRVFDHAAFDAKLKTVGDEAFGPDADRTEATLEDWAAANGRIMKGVPRPPFKPNALYNKHGDGLQVHLCPDDHYVQWLCPGVEVMRAFSDRRIVGFNVWGLSHVVARDGGELRRLPDPGERFLTVQAFRPDVLSKPIEPISRPKKDTD